MLIYVWLPRVFGFVRGLSPAAMSRASSLAAVLRLLTMRLLFCRARAPGAGPSVAEPLGSGTPAQPLCTGLAALRHEGSSQIRDPTCLCLLHWQADSFPLSHQGSPRHSFMTLVIPLSLGCSLHHRPSILSSLCEKIGNHHNHISSTLITNLLFMVILL